jgi:hypothetical protein
MKETNILILNKTYINMRKAIETIRKSNTAKNGDERVIIDSNNNKHLEFFMNGSWRHSNKCKIVLKNQCLKI